MYKLPIFAIHVSSFRGCIPECRGLIENVHCNLQLTEFSEMYISGSGLEHLAFSTVRVVWVIFPTNQ